MFFTIGLAIVSCNSLAAKQCSLEDQPFVESLVHSSLFLEYETNTSLKENSQPFCEVKSALVMDGMSFYLYKFEKGKRYISVHNGLDGTSKMFGPFEASRKEL